MNCAYLIPIALIMAGCASKSVPLSSLPDSAQSYPCSYQDSSTTVTTYDGELPLVPVSGPGYVEGYQRMTTTRVRLSAIVDYPDFNPDQPPRVWLCKKQTVRGLYCGGSRPYVETKADADVCEKAKRVSYNGMQLRVECGTYEISSFDRTKETVFAEARIL